MEMLRANAARIMLPLGAATATHLTATRGAARAEGVVRRFCASGTDGPLSEGGWLQRVLADNQVTSGGLALMAVGAGLATASRLARFAFDYGQRHLFVRAEIDSRSVDASGVGR